MDLRELVPSELSPPLKPTLVIDTEGLKAVSDFFSRSNVFGFDVETNVVPTFFSRRLRTVQIGNRDEQYVIDLLAFAGSTEDLVRGQGNRQTSSWAKPVVDTLREGLESPDHLKVGVHLQFDYESALWCLGLRPWNFYDCYLAEKVLHCGRVNFFADGFWAMDDMVARYSRLKVKKELQTSFALHSPLTPEQIDYAALDTRLPLAVRAGQLPLIEKHKLTRCVALENDAIGAFGDMHINGIKLDTNAWMSNVEATKALHAERVKVLDTHFMSVVGEKKKPTVDLYRLEQEWRDETDKPARAQARQAYYAARRALKEWEDNSETWEGEAAINYGSNTQLLTALRKMGFNSRDLPNTNDKSLSKLSEHPVIKAIQDYRETAKILSTYGESFIEKYVDPDTGRVHSRINQIGAATGRTSSTNPNIQNIPKGSAFRSCFVAKPGHVIITVDMSGAELRIIAEDSGSKVWIEAFENGWDVHSIGAEMMQPVKWAAGIEKDCAFAASKQKCKCQVHKKLRDDNKAINFGVAYGMEEAALAARLGISKKAARELLMLWRGSPANKEVNDYLIASGNNAKTHLHSRSLSGRWRLFEKPDWDRAREIAIERFKQDGKDLMTMDTKDISRVYYAMYGSIEREGKNMRVQGTNVDIAKIAMGAGVDKNGEPFMWQRLYPEFGADLVNFVHDEFVVECPVETAPACLEFIGSCIRRAGAELMSKVVMEYEGGISDRWKK